MYICPVKINAQALDVGPKSILWYKMKKTFSLLAVLLLFLPLRSQGAEGDVVDLTIIPQVEGYGVFSKGEKPEFGFANTNLYTNFVLTPSEHFSFTLVNHWLTAPTIGEKFWKEQNEMLYRTLGYSWATNCIDFCHADFTFGNWSFGIGKDVIHMGGIEFDPFDYDQAINLVSDAWLLTNVYQWGGRVTFTSSSECTALTVAMRTSPAGEHPFSSGLKTFSGEWRGNYGPFSNIWQVAAIQVESTTSKHKYIPVVTLGQQLELGALTLGFQWMNRVGGEDEVLSKGHTFLGQIILAPGDKFSLEARCIRQTAVSQKWLAGLIADFYPTEDIRIRVSGAYDTLFKTTTATLGVTFNIHI